MLRNANPLNYGRRQAIRIAASDLATQVQCLPIRGKLTKLRNVHRGETCVVVGMGPSLRTSDLDRLGGVKTFACNKIYLAFSETKWRPTYYTVSDVLVAEQNREAISDVKAIKIFPNWVRHRLPQATDVLWIPEARSMEAWEKAGVGFSKDLRRGIQPGGCTVLYDQLQIVYHMGFSRVVLIGVDFSFGGMQLTGESCEQGEVLLSQGENNHFLPGYRSKGEKWTIPKLDQQQTAFTVARRIFEESGRRLVNASRETNLQALERADFDELFPLT